jgi:pimeloyl-ACP methyl ester carboxylesterase
MRPATRAWFGSTLFLTAWLAAGTASAAQPEEVPQSDTAFTVETDDAAGTTTVTLPAADGLISWGDIVRASAQLGRLDDSALSDLPGGTLDLNRADSRLAIAALDLVLPPEVSVRVTGRDNAEQLALKLTVDRRRLRERNRDFKRSLRDRLGASEQPYGLVLDEHWESRANGRSLVVLIHGYNSTSRSLEELRAELNHRGWPCAKFDYPNDGPIDESGRLLSEELRRFAADHPDQAVAIVAHSMGGLVARVAIENPDLESGSVRQLIMVGTPNQGSQMAHFACGLECCEQLVLRREYGAENLLRLSIADGLNEARSDLKPDSMFLSDLNARDRNPNVHYSLLLGTKGPLTAAQLEELQSAVSAAAERNRVAQLLAPRVAEPLSDMEELLDGAGDGAVAVKRGRLEGVDDTVLLPVSHLSVTRKLESESRRELLEAIVGRLDQQAPAALDTDRRFRQNAGSNDPETEPVHEPQSP